MVLAGGQDVLEQARIKRLGGAFLSCGESAPGFLAHPQRVELESYPGVERFDVISTLGRSLLRLFGVDQLQEDAFHVVVGTLVEPFHKIRSLLDRPPDLP